MSKKALSRDQLKERLTAAAPQHRQAQVRELGPPLREQGMELTLDQLRSYEHNPRTERNPKYDEIKESIREVGLQQPPVVSQRPGDDKWVILSGGNTRLSILQELYEETGDPRYFTHWCIYKPWPGEAEALAGHLSENETRGDLSWIEKALGVVQLRRFIEETEGALSQAAFAERARELGFAIGPGHISRMTYTVEHIWPALPQTLRAGMGRPQVERLITFREVTLQIWQRAELDATEFGVLWNDAVSQFDQDGQTQLPWDVLEDRVFGALSDESGIHFSVIEHTFNTIIDYRRRRWSIDDPEHQQDVWSVLDAELGRLRGDPEAPQILFGEPHQAPGSQPERTTEPASETLVISDEKPDEEEEDLLEPPKALSASVVTGNASKTTSPTGTPSSRNAAADDDSSLKEELSRLREQLREREATIRHLETATVSPDAPATEQAGGAEDDAERLDELTVGGVVTESDAQRALREQLARDAGEEAANFQRDALHAVPLMSAGPMHPITDLWRIEPQYRTPRELRMQIGQFAQALARWAEFAMPTEDLDDRALQLSDEGIGFTLLPLGEKHEASYRAQLIWQFLAGLSGETHPGYPSEPTLLGELFGTCDPLPLATDHDTGDVAMPDEILVRAFRLVRLIRVLRTHPDYQ
ncbi:ParB family protein [Billgrantia desiderata]|uniref:ParB family protein n=1 Tax=Billgrantia desiderata TaxID=52021 RepID=UPI001F2558B3|nr:ParB family protein [Halomonas desiderata]MCE8014097.1 ParB N-terminal domain-containing protein [Halomonas desiderata]